MAVYQGLGDVLSMVARSVRPSYLDWAWQTVTLPIDIDFETGHVLKNSENSGQTCLEFLGQRYSEYEVIYTDGSGGDEQGLSCVRFVEGAFLPAGLHGYIC